MSHRLRIGDRVFELAPARRHLGRTGYVLNPNAGVRDGRSRSFGFAVGPGRVLVGWSNGALSTHERRELAATLRHTSDAL